MQNSEIRRADIMTLTNSTGKSRSQQRSAVWRNCVVALIDLAGTKRETAKGDGRGSTLMRKFHKLVVGALRERNHIEDAYVWNDSVLLLAYVTGGPEEYESLFQELDVLKQQIGALTKCYGIAVKGQAFPRDNPHLPSHVTIIRASSYAMANCFAIEQAARAKRRRGDWYIDARIIRHLRLLAPEQDTFTVTMLPSGRSRRVYVHYGPLCALSTADRNLPSRPTRRRRARGT